MIYLDGLQPGGVAPGTHNAAMQASRVAQEARSDLKELAHQVERLSLLNQAMWEILRTRLGLTDADLESLAQEVDMRDGRTDGKITARPLRCPNCDRISNSKHYKCLYCGQLFERPIFG